jgi:hypothetical protein
MANGRIQAGRTTQPDRHHWAVESSHYEEMEVFSTVRQSGGER